MLKHLLIFYLFCKEKRNDTPDEVIAAVLKVSEIQFSDSEDDIEEDFAATSSEKDERAIQSVP